MEHFVPIRLKNVSNAEIMMIIISLVGVLIGTITLLMVMMIHRKSIIEKTIEYYIQNTVQYPGEGWDFLVKAGALNLSNKNIEFLCREIEKRGIKHPFDSFPDVLEKKNFKRTLQAYFDKERKKNNIK